MQTLPLRSHPTSSNLDLCPLPTRIVHRVDTGVFHPVQIHLCNLITTKWGEQTCKPTNTFIHLARQGDDAIDHLLTGFVIDVVRGGSLLEDPCCLTERCSTQLVELLDVLICAELAQNNKVTDLHTSPSTSFCRPSLTGYAGTH